ncbi:phage tail fiber protein [Yersinia pseudotuberculosis]
MDISGFGTIVNIRASKTFPAGFNVTQFADDAEPTAPVSENSETSTH